MIAKVVSIFVPLRVDAADERRGLDISQHGEKAYPSFTGMD
jgi:Amt family ammonium transporter